MGAPGIGPGAGSAGGAIYFSINGTLTLTGRIEANGER